ncbi:MAG: type III-B CRISPR module RAMP protein Cmr6 [Candidatus Brocadia sp. UTAMX2]|jgi:CRISPR-associated protein Cmr6|nr:MAG: type III-B CRISPR module RAMP protein Cmr6 [Candidatus Brocadia sp. UTAMX2]
MTDDWKKTLSKADNIPLTKGNEKVKKDYLKQGNKVNPESQGQHGGKDMPPNRCLPLYNKLKHEGTTPRKMEDSAHTGLLFDKFCDHWSGPERNWKPEKPQKKDKAVKQKFLDDIVNQLKKNDAPDKLLSQYHLRRGALLAALNGNSYSFKTSWRFVSGLGMGHVLETGFVWHRTLGVPYLPGSSVKGLIRAWADPKPDKDGNPLGYGDPKKWEEQYKQLFGDSKDMGAGRLIVFDAIPEGKPKLEVDIMNPHYGDYYSKKIINGQPAPPADYLSPNPIFFLTVASGVPFKFALAPRPGIGNSTDLTNGYNLLKEALDTIGIGAKTAVGYGYFE